MNAAFDRMTTDEQIAHVQDLWDRIAERPGNSAVGEAWRRELARLSAEYDAKPDIAMPWEQVQAAIRALLGKEG